MPSTYEGFSGGAPASRIRAANDKPINSDADYVLDWMIAASSIECELRARSSDRLGGGTRRARCVLEAFRVDYQFASAAQIHRRPEADNLTSFQSL